MVIENQNQPTPPLPPVAAKEGGWRDIVSTVSVLLVAILVAFSLIAFVFQSYQVDGPSMENTLQNNDRLIVWKAARSWARITGHQYVPKRGDIIIFSEQNLVTCGQSGTRQLIKRVIGLPGEHVVVNNDVITVYNKANPNGFVPDKTLPYGGPDGKKIPATNGNVDVTLASNEIFVSGDNRPDSCDSRAFGPVNTKDIIGKLALRVLPLNKAERF